jgi:hypothetical protein
MNPIPDPLEIDDVQRVVQPFLPGLPSAGGRPELKTASRRVPALSKNCAFTGMRDRAQRKGFYTGQASASGEDTGMAVDVRNSGASVVAVHAQHDRAIRNRRS